MNIANSIANTTKASVAATILVLLAACGDTREVPNSHAPSTVTVAPVIAQTITEWDEFTGRLKAPESVELRPRVSGYIERVAFSEGTVVKAGDLLFNIDDRPFKAEVARLQANLANAQSELTLRSTEYQRAKTLSLKGAIAQELVDNRLAAYQQAQAAQQSAAAALQLAELNLSYTRVVAPIDGRVSNAMITRGNFVSAGQSLLTTIVSTDYLYAYFDADEQAYLKYARLAKEGTRPSSRDVRNPVLLGLASENNYPHHGYIDFVDNRIDPQTGTIKGRAVFDNQQGLLLPGLFARIKLIGSATYQGILVDDKAIASDLNQKYVLVVDSNHVVQYRAVELGEKLAGLRIIKSGLNAEDRIIIKGLQKVGAGDTVAIESAAMASAATLQELSELQARVDRLDDNSLYAASPLQATHSVIDSDTVSQGAES